MKIINLSDLHLLITNPVSRKDNLVEVQFKKLDFVINFALKHNAILNMPGDIFDTPRSWYLAPKIAELLSNVDVYCVYGQHDTYYYNKSTRHATSLGMLDKSNIVTILGEHPVIHPDDNVAFYGCSITEHIPKPEVTHMLNVLSIHAPISDTALYSTHEFINAEKFITESEFDIVLCGDIHRKFLFEKNNKVILNSGPLLRKESTEYNMTHKPGFYFIDTETKKIEFIEVPHEPSEKVLTRQHITTQQELKSMRNEFVANLHDKGNIKNDKKNIKDKIVQYFDDYNIDDGVKELFSQITHK